MAEEGVLLDGTSRTVATRLSQESVTLAWVIIG